MHSTLLFPRMEYHQEALDDTTEFYSVLANQKALDNATAFLSTVVVENTFIDCEKTDLEPVLQPIQSLSICSAFGTAVFNFGTSKFQQAKTPSPFSYENGDAGSKSGDTGSESGDTLEFKAVTPTTCSSENGDGGSDSEGTLEFKGAATSTTCSSENGDDATEFGISYIEVQNLASRYALYKDPRCYRY